MEDKPDFMTKVQIEEAKKYCKECGLEHNGNGTYVYSFMSSMISVPYFLAAYHHDKSKAIRQQIEELKKENKRLTTESEIACELIAALHTYQKSINAEYVTYDKQAYARADALANEYVAIIEKKYSFKKVECGE